MRRLVLLMLLAMAGAPPAAAQDADSDGIPDAVEAGIGSDPALTTPLEVVFEDRARGEGDESVGADLTVAHDLVRVAFGGVARDRWVWRLDFTEPWVVRGDVALIVYMDADNDPGTGREGGSVQGTDLMVRPGSVQAFGCPGAPRNTSVADGNSLYLAFDADVKVQDEQAACHAYVLIQNRENPQDSDRTPWFDARAAASEAPPPKLPRDHPMHIAPERLERVRVRVPIESGGRRAIVTWITSWPTEATVQFGRTEEYGRQAQTERLAQNHRVVLDGLEPDSTYHLRIRTRGHLGDLVSSEDITFSTSVAEPADGVVRERVPLRVSGAAGQRRPVTSGLPFPPGALGSAEHVRVLDPDGREVPAQVEVVTRWPDGSVKWVLLDFQADVPDSGQARYALEFGRRVRRAAVEQGLTIDESDEAIAVGTGTLRVRLGREDFALLGEAWLDRDGDGTYADDERITEAEGAGIVLTDLDGEEFTSRGAPESLEVTRRGPLHAVVSARGRHRDGAGQALFRYEVRLHFYAGLPLVHVFHTFENDRVEETFTTVRSMNVRIPMAGGARGCEVLLEDGRSADLPAAARLVQSFDDSFRLEGAAAATGRRAPGAVIVRGEGGDALIGVRNFWQLYPKSLGCDDRGAVIGIMPELPQEEYAQIEPELEDKLYYYLLGGVYKLHSGVSKTHELLIRFSPPGKAGDLTTVAGQAEAPALAFATPEWYADSKAFGDITPRTPGEFERYDAMADRILERIVAVREDEREYGMLNFGDWWGERGFNWGNIEYDTQHGLFLQFARSARRDFFDNAVWAARHNIDVDIIHHARQAEDVGKPHVHCMCHTGDYYPQSRHPQAIARGSFNTGHVWTRGNLECALLTGDQRAMRVALRTARCLAGPLTTGFRMSKGAERATAWPLFGVIAAYEATGDEYYLNAAHIITREVIAEQDKELGHWHIPAGYSKVKPTPIGGYAWCAGLLLTSLELANQHLHDPEIDETIVRAARWLARDEWIAERKGFRSASCPTLNASVTPGYECYRTPAAMLRAYELSGEERFLEIAHMGFSYAVARGGGSGKGGSVQLTITPHAVYKLKQAGITSLDTSRWEEAAFLHAPGWVPVGDGAPAALQVLVESNRDEAQEMALQIAGLPGDASARGFTVSLGPREVRSVQLDLPVLDPAPGETLPLLLRMRAGDETAEASLLVDCIAPGGVGRLTGLIAGEEDFLAPALDELGVEYERVQALDELGRFARIYLGTQAHTLDAAGIARSPETLLRWVYRGGTLVVSQLNDDGWSTRFLPGVVVLAEENATSGRIRASEHALFTTPNRVRDLAGMQMYDTIARADGWQVLMEDEAGRAAIIATSCGEGRILAMMPSVERYVTGALDDGKLEQVAREFLHNIIAWASASE
ncbi:MAG: hypothetical protein U9R79_11275 [Armatimonadota bacterium]|nr:hypothetical protein [Armatimonadota bacterium]